MLKIIVNLLLIFYLSFIQNNILITARTIANIAVEKNHHVSNHDTNASANIIINTLIIALTNHKVRILSGRVKNLRILPTNQLTIAKTTAATIAVRYESTDTLGSTYAATTINRAETKILKISFFILKV